MGASRLPRSVFDHSRGAIFAKEIRVEINQYGNRPTVFSFRRESFVRRNKVLLSRSRRRKRQTRKALAEYHYFTVYDGEQGGGRDRAGLRDPKVLRVDGRRFINYERRDRKHRSVPRRPKWNNKRLRHV